MADWEGLADAEGSADWEGLADAEGSADWEDSADREGSTNWEGPADRVGSTDREGLTEPVGPDSEEGLSRCIGKGSALFSVWVQCLGLMSCFYIMLLYLAAMSCFSVLLQYSASVSFTPAGLNGPTWFPINPKPNKERRTIAHDCTRITVECATKCGEFGPALPTRRQNWRIRSRWRDAEFAFPHPAWAKQTATRPDWW